MWDGLSFVLRAAVAFPVGFVLPGLLIAGLLLQDQKPVGAAIRVATAFFISLLVLFHLMFWSALVALPLRPAVAWPLELLLIVVLVVLRLRQRRDRIAVIPPIEADLHEEPISKGILIGIVCAVGAAMLLRTSLWPLAGDDNPVRWDFLATRILKFQSLSFYPPITGPDFRQYFYPDGMGPVVSFAYWWIYSSVGQHAPRLTSILCTAQYAAIIAFVFGIGRKMHSSRAGAFAASALASSALFTWGIALAQETGLTALSVVAMMYFLLEAEDDIAENRWRWLILAGMAAGLGALAREYGCAYLILGAIALLWMRQGWRTVAIFGCAFVAVAMPWYVRNLIRTGNPFYNIRLGPFYVTPVHAGIFDMYQQRLGVATWTAADWRHYCLDVLQGGELQFTVGVIAALWLLRKWGFISLAVVASIALWLKSVGYTNGGTPYSMRVLTPTFALLSVLAGVWMARLAIKPAMHWACVVILICAGLWGFVAMSLFNYPLDADVLGNWSQLVFATHPEENDWHEQLPQIFPAGAGVLTESPYVATALAEAPVYVVPVWSPEVQYLTDDTIDPKMARKILLDSGIHYVVAENHMNLDYLVEHMRLYHDDSRSWKLVQEVRGVVAVYELPDNR